MTSPFGKRTLRPLTDFIDRRVDETLRSKNGGGASGSDAALIADLRRELAELQNRQRSFELLLDGSGRGMARMPQPGHLSATARELAAITGDPDTAKRNVTCAFRLLVALESLGVGRIAGGTMNICGKLAAIPLLDAPNEDVLEIGTLYGLFAAALLRMLERAGRDPQLTIVDPLIGIQLQPGTTERPDASGAPVRMEAVRTNLALAGAAGAAVRVRQGYSTDSDVQAEIGDRRYGAIIVDGDHSQAGVAADLRWVEEIVAPGGIVVLDDFGDRRWQGVEAALNEHMRGPTRLTLLGRVATSGYLRAN